MKKEFLCLALVLSTFNSHALLSRMQMNNFKARQHSSNEFNTDPLQQQGQQQLSQPQAAPQQPPQQMAESYYQRGPQPQPQAQVQPQPQPQLQPQPTAQSYYHQRQYASTVGNNFANGEVGDEARVAALAGSRAQGGLDREYAMQNERPIDRPEREQNMIAPVEGHHAPSYGAAKRYSRPAPVRRKPTRMVAAQPETVYSIQLISSSDREQIVQFLARHGYQHKARIIKEHRYGRAWYSALYGRYQDKAVAQRTLAQLPRGLRVNRPWIRTREERPMIQVAENRSMPQRRTTVAHHDLGPAQSYHEVQVPHPMPRQLPPPEFGDDSGTMVIQETS